MLHVTPGVAHCTANLFNAWKARIPLVVIGGQQHTELSVQEPILWSNTVDLVKQYTKWSYEIKNAYELPTVLQRAFKEAMTAPMGPVFLSWPVDVSLEETARSAYPVTKVATRTRATWTKSTRRRRCWRRRRPRPSSRVTAAACPGRGRSLVQLAELLGAPVYSESLSTNMNFPSRDYHWQWELPGDANGMRSTLGKHDTVLFCGFSSHAPMTVYNGGPPLIPDSVTKLYLHYDEWEIAKNYPGAAAILGDVKTSLVPLNAAVASDPNRHPHEVDPRNAALKQSHEQLLVQWANFLEAQQDKLPINSAYVAAELAKLEPQGLVYVDEANTGNQPFQRLLKFDDPLSYYSGRGVALGYSMPAALGVALATKDRKVVNVVGDGAALFYPQVFWTAVQNKLPILFVVLNNHEYKTLKQGLEAMKKFWDVTTEPPGLNLGPPGLHHAKIAEAFGVPGERVTDPREVRAALERGLTSDGPYVLEFMVQREVNDTWPTG